MTETIDTTAPVVDSVDASGPGFVIGAGGADIGQRVNLTATFSEPVLVAGGTPTLPLDNGGTATYSGGSGTNALTFVTTVASGSAPFHVTGTSLGGATIRDLAGHDADLSGLVQDPISFGTTGGITGPGLPVAPTITSVAETPASGDLGIGSKVTLTLTPSAAVTVTGAPTLSLNDGGLATYDPKTSTPTSLVFDYTIAANDTNVSSLAVVAVNVPSGTFIEDGAANPANASLIGLAQAGPRISTSDPSLFGAITHDVTSTGGDVYALYETILGRAPDPVELESSVAALDKGKSTEAIARGLLKSAAYTHDNGAYAKLSDAAFLGHLYENAVHHSPDAAELQGWDAALSHGTSRPRVAADIALSNESRSVLASTFQAGVFVPDATASDIARLFYGLLDRAPDPAGLATFENAAHQGETLRSIAAGIIASPEYATLHGHQSNAQFVEALFEGAFGRSAGAAEATGWRDALASGCSRAAVVIGIAESPEGVAHLKSQIESGFHIA